MGTWQGIQEEVTRRISEKIWEPGQLIPGEVELAKEFGCARATVNRALRQLAELDVLDRKRKGGTRVALYPVRKATLDIPITRIEIENRGALYRHKILSRRLAVPPKLIRKNMDVSGEQNLLHLRSLHYANEKPFLYEDRWVNLDSAPGIELESFSNKNANEWLVENALFSHGDIAFRAKNASKTDAKYLGCDEGVALFIVDRTTWNRASSITSVRNAYAPGFEMNTQI